MWEMDVEIFSSCVFSNPFFVKYAISVFQKDMVTLALPLDLVGKKQFAFG